MKRQNIYIAKRAEVKGKVSRGLMTDGVERKSLGVGGRWWEREEVVPRIPVSLLWE